MDTGRPPENKRSRKPAHPVRRDVSEEMKNFAEHTMNELLGWYGYDKVELQESDATDGQNRVKRNHISVVKENSVPKPHAVEKKIPSSSSSSSASDPVRNGEKESTAIPVSPSSSSYSSSPRVKEQHVIVPLIKPSAVEDVQNVQIVCVWCQKEGMKRYSLLMGSELKSFCSEKCFAACRRAYFKRNKARDEDRHGDQSPPPGQTLDTPTRLLLKMNNNTRVCDWCKHVRHTKEYLDFGSGEERLQFCSTKCLNQYKMDVFYREARAALTNSKDEENCPKPVTENQKLLTPEAWDSPAKTLSPQTPTACSSQRTPVSSSYSRIQTAMSPSSPAGPSHVTLEPPRPPQMPLPFIRPPLHAQGLRSPAHHPPRNPPRPVSPTQRASFAPPPLLQPYPAPYVPFHPALPPQMPPPWPQPMMMLPYPVFVPIPVPIPIPIPVSPQTGHKGVIRSLQEQEKERPGHSSSNEHRVKTEQCASPFSASTSERQVIQCLRRNPVKEESHDSHIQTHVLRKALYTSVVTPTSSASVDSRIVSPASLYSLARSTAIQAASLSLDSSSAQIPSPLSDCEDVKENSYMGGRGNGSANPWPAGQTDCQSDQSKDSRVEEETPPDVEHTYARSVPPKLREKNTHANTQIGGQTHLHTQTQTWEKNTHADAQGSEQSGRDDPEPPVKRRCLRIRDQNK